MAKAKAGSGFLLMRPVPKYELACRACGRTWADQTPMFVVKQHMGQEHDRTDIEFLVRRKVEN